MAINKPIEQMTPSELRALARQKERQAKKEAEATGNAFIKAGVSQYEALAILEWYKTLDENSKLRFKEEANKIEMRDLARKQEMVNRLQASKGKKS